MKADLHIHTKHPHGDFDPDQLAREIVGSGLDICALTDARAIHPSAFDTRARIFDLAETVGRRVVTLIGAEAGLEWEGLRYHVGLIFPRIFQDMDDIPRIPSEYVDLRTIEAIKAREEAVTILYHPTLVSRSELLYDDRTLSLMAENTIDGVEVKSVRVMRMKSVLTTEAQRMYDEVQKAGHRTNPLAAIGCSDATDISHLGSVFTQFSDNNGNSVHSLFEAIRTGQTKAVVPFEMFLQ